jgi:hypothetical protein
MELALLRFDVQMVLQEASQENPDACDVILQGGRVDQDVVNLHVQACSRNTSFTNAWNTDGALANS